MKNQRFKKLEGGGGKSRPPDKNDDDNGDGFQSSKLKKRGGNDVARWFPEVGEYVLWRDATGCLQKVVVVKVHHPAGVSPLPHPTKHMFTVRMENHASVLVSLIELQPEREGFFNQNQKDRDDVLMGNKHVSDLEKEKENRDGRSVK